MTESDSATDERPVASAAAVQHLRLRQVDGVGPVLFDRLITHFRSVQSVFEASVAELRRVEGIGRTTADAVRRARDSDGYTQELEKTARIGARIICREDHEYPRLLKHIPDAPICLYVLGEVREHDAIALAVVGSRRCTRYGCEQARRFGSLLAGAGITVVSGMARGIDGYAHEGALAAGGRSLAVWGNGLAHLYPPEHADLADAIRDNGAILSELPVDAAPEAARFPVRNRIIVGMCLGVLVVEATRQSGALISARLAGEYDREVFAVPGRVDTPQAAGTHRLIRDGAKLVTDLDDILEELGDLGRFLRPPQSAPTGSGDVEEQGFAVPPGLNPAETAVLEAVGTDPTSVETICTDIGLPISRVLGALTTLELRGAVQRQPGGCYVRR